ncbi:MAG: hypothetical protein HYU39_04930 [Thaumarchaeota archaeon]|nr:hypothetical protein [Nitrososphaerota archaeon]
MNNRGIEEKISDAVAQLNQGDYVTATWIDASQTRPIRLQGKPLPNHTVETRKTTSGRFITLQRGDTWHDPHLVLGIEKTDDQWEIISIPLSLVKQLSSAEAKEPLKGTPRSAKRRFADGSVKNYGD